MEIADAKRFVGQICEIHWHDRLGSEQRSIAQIEDVVFIPLYGGFVVTLDEDIRVDNIRRLVPATGLRSEDQLGLDTAAA